MRQGKSAFGLIAVGFALMSWTAVRAEDATATVHYACDDGKTIEAAYFSDRVDLVLGDGRTLSLPQTMSGSGIRYANADDSFVFWSRGDDAFATEGDPDKPTYANCVGTPR